jgi:hypothetical protein
VWVGRHYRAEIGNGPREDASPQKTAQGAKYIALRISY